MYQQGKSEIRNSKIRKSEILNQKCSLRGHILAFALFLSIIDIADSYTYLLLVYLGDDRLKHYEIFSSDMFPVFTQVMANMQCPFNNNIAIIDGGIL